MRRQLKLDFGHEETAAPKSPPIDQLGMPLVSEAALNEICFEVADFFKRLKQVNQFIGTAIPMDILH